ncbi:MAG: hypothetical protein F6K55_17535 [Moorea sp. SIO4A3]|nr:hypothetical protein [Moorena sp. SIO4A3]
MGILVEWASWWNGHLARYSRSQKSEVRSQKSEVKLLRLLRFETFVMSAPALATAISIFPDELSEQGSKRGKMKARPRVVRYGADYTNAGYEAENKSKSAPNAPYASDWYWFKISENGVTGAR